MLWWCNPFWQSDPHTGIINLTPFHLIQDNIKYCQNTDHISATYIRHISHIYIYERHVRCMLKRCDGYSDRTLYCLVWGEKVLSLQCLHVGLTARREGLPVSHHHIVTGSVTHPAVPCCQQLNTYLHLVKDKECIELELHYHTASLVVFGIHMKFTGMCLVLFCLDIEEPASGSEEGGSQ